MTRTAGRSQNRDWHEVRGITFLPMDWWPQWLEFGFGTGKRRVRVMTFVFATEGNFRNASIIRLRVLSILGFGEFFMERRMASSGWRKTLEYMKPTFHEEMERRIGVRGQLVLWEERKCIAS